MEDMLTLKTNIPRKPQFLFMTKYKARFLERYSFCFRHFVLILFSFSKRNYNQITFPDAINIWLGLNLPVQETRYNALGEIYHAHHEVQYYFQSSVTL